MPFAFRNDTGALVGFDVEMAHLLAREMKVGVEFVRIERDAIAERLARGVCDLVVSGITVTPERTQSVEFSIPAMHLTLALVVQDSERHRFESWESIGRRDGLRVGVGTSAYFRQRLQDLVPDAELVTMTSPREFFRATGAPVDALAYAAEPASAWTLVYPKFAVTVPTPDPITAPTGYALPRDEPRLRNFVDAFIRLKIQDNTTRRLFAHWFEGRSLSGRDPRWSIARDLLGWR